MSTGVFNFIKTIQVFGSITQKTYLKDKCDFFILLYSIDSSTFPQNLHFNSFHPGTTIGQVPNKQHHLLFFEVMLSSSSMYCYHLGLSASALYIAS